MCDTAPSAIDTFPPYMRELHLPLFGARDTAQLYACFKDSSSPTSVDLTEVQHLPGFPDAGQWMGEAA